MGDYRTRFDAADHPADAECQHGGDRFHHQFAAPAVRKYASAARSFATTVVAAPRTRRACLVLWIVPDDVAVESVAEIKPSTDSQINRIFLRNLWIAFHHLQFEAKESIVPPNQMVGESFHQKWLSG